MLQNKNLIRADMQCQNGPQDQNRTFAQSPINLSALAWYPRGTADSTAQRINNRHLWATFTFSNDQRLRITKNIASLNSNKTSPSKWLFMAGTSTVPMSVLIYFHLYDQSKQGMDRQNKNI